MKKLGVVAILLLSGCVTQQPQDPTKESSQRESARIHTELGAGYYAQKQPGIALEEFNDAVRIDPTYAQAYNGLGLVYAALNEDDKADASYKKSLQLDPGNSESHNNYGTFLCSRKRIDESIGQFLEAVKNPLYTTPGSAYMNAGICSLKKQDVKNAEIYLQKALQAQPLLHQAAYQLALIHFDRGQFQLAHNDLQNALVSNPTPEMLWLGVRIERVLGDKNAESSYTLLLKSKYPDSDQTKALLAGQ